MGGDQLRIAAQGGGGTCWRFVGLGSRMGPMRKPVKATEERENSDVLLPIGGFDKRPTCGGTNFPSPPRAPNDLATPLQACPVLVPKKVSVNP